MTTRTKCLLACIGLGILLSSPAEARTCSIRQITDVAFGNYFPMQAGPLDARGRIRVFCWGRALPGQGDAYTIRLSGVLEAGMFGRRMNSGANELAYNLFKDAARTDVWGDGTFGATPVVRFLRDSQANVGNHWVYGRIPPLLDPGPGVYSDVVDVTIEF